MKTSLVTTAMVIAALCVPGRATAPQLMLFQASGFLTPAAEANAPLTETSRRTLSLRRADRFIKDVNIVKVDTSVIQSSIIFLEMPNRTVFRFNGEAQELTSQSSPGYFFWLGRWEPLQPRSDTESAEHERSGVPVLYLSFDGRMTSVWGRLVVQGQQFEMVSLNSPYVALIERGLNANSPPIDWEPPGSRQTRASRSHTDWPPGLVTDKLKASIETSSVGQSLSPEFCDDVSSCGAVTRFSCHPETDGPEMFFDNTTGVLVMACGGSCMMGPGLPDSKLCTACPPPEWTRCEAYSAKRR